MKVYLIGVCGTAMATLAAMLVDRGHAVHGSDAHVYPPMSDFLAARGIVCLDGFDEAHITSDIELVVIGNAVSRGNPEVEAVLDRRLRYRSLPEMVRDEFLWDRDPIVVAGTHGKTTTTALVSWVLADCGRDPSFLVGGLVENFASSYRLGDGSEFVIEGDEYDSAFFDKTAKFLKYVPRVAVVGNLEFDHADIYADFEAIQLAVRRLVSLLPRGGRLVLGADSAPALEMAEGAPCPVTTFGFSDAADWRAVELVTQPDGTHFGVEHHGARVCEVDMPLVGAFNVRNVLAATVVAHELGIELEAVATALARFKGVKRRLELRGRARGVTVFDDFAHHPTAVRETLAGVRAAFPTRRVWAVFEPRSATSCRRVFQADFAAAFQAADEVIIGEVYRSSLPDDERLSELELVEGIGRTGPRARHFADVDDIVGAVAQDAGDGDLVVVMSNGAFGGIHDRLLKALSAEDPGLRRDP
ncbi:MAG: UDP-N-acetylmuramate:L-alanyl-gamma-D-glutamyl-meso-diaminopimelate ligase [Vicinamibacterales bacterium]|nr:UDP-N-acetylmuramate:L-alanyl-gamma-D-glutamyl-meso-diaminopimelate ligase [Vicinamibacterales bacterium]